MDGPNLAYIYPPFSPLPLLVPLHWSGWALKWCLLDWITLSSVLCWWWLRCSIIFFFFNSTALLSIFFQWIHIFIWNKTTHKDVHTYCRKTKFNFLKIHRKNFFTFLKWILFGAFLVYFKMTSSFFWMAIVSNLRDYNKWIMQHDDNSKLVAKLCSQFLISPSA